MDNGEIPLLMGHLTDNIIDFRNMNFISRDTFDKLSSGKIKSGDIIYCLRGSLGKKGLVTDVNDGAIASSLVIIRPNTDVFSNEYLMLALDSPDIKRQWIKANNGSSQANLSAKSFT